MSIFQSVITARNDIALPGMFSHSGPRRVIPKFARGLVKAGVAVFKVPGSTNAADLGPGLAVQNPVPGVAAAASAILSGGASSASLQTITSFNGTTGGTEMQPARFVTFTFSSLANWDATSATLTGIDSAGQVRSESIAIPDAGNATVTSTNRFRQVTSITIPAQSGTSGTFTVGVAALTSGFLLADILGIVVRNVVKTSVSSSGLYGYPGITSNLVTAEYIDGETLDVLDEGSIWCVTETAVTDRDPVYVRVAAGAGGSQLGALRNDADSASAILIPNARFLQDCSAGKAPAIFRGF
jgi:hypothetical protein